MTDRPLSTGNPETPEAKRAIELAYLNRQIESLESLERSDALLLPGLERLKTLQHQRDMTRAGGSNPPEPAGTPEPENPSPLEADAPPFPGAQGPPHEIEIGPGQSSGGASPFPVPSESTDPVVWDVNWLIHQAMAGLTNIDTSNRIQCEAQMRQAAALERLASMAEARELKSAFDMMSAVETTADDADEKAEHLQDLAGAIDALVGPLLKVNSDGT